MTTRLLRQPRKLPRQPPVQPPTPAAVLQALHEELIACLALLEAQKGRYRDDRAQGQKEAFTHIQTFLKNQEAP